MPVLPSSGIAGWEPRFEKNLQPQPFTPGRRPASGAARRPSQVSRDARRVPPTPQAPQAGRWGRSAARSCLPSEPDGPRGPPSPPAASGRGFHPLGLPAAPPPAGAPLEPDRLTRAPLAHTHRVVLCFPPRPAPPPEPAAAWLAESSRGRRFPPPARGEPRGQDGEGGRGAQRWPEAGGECPQEAPAGAGATGRPGTLPASIPGPGSQPGTPKGAEAAPTPSSARTHALLPPPYGNLQPPKVTRRRFLGLAARPPPPGQRSCRGDLGGGADSSERRPRGGGELRAPHPPLSSPASGGWRGRPLPGRELRAAERSRRDRDSAAKFFLGHPRVLRGRERTRADSESGRAPERRDPRATVGGTSPGCPPPLPHALPPLRLKRGSGCPQSGSPTPSQPAARGIPAVPCAVPCAAPAAALRRLLGPPPLLK
ncbi:uncharacterized protein LOC110320242 [Mus pahari]|uniref:uncharacterized protein LOC110320242 n=1 Tax=Mus pahari TaxID=10093 RepID=UPI000A30EFA2|nr:uncharacterized protein LOC110320242 [Mus pahari]